MRDMNCKQLTAVGICVIWYELWTAYSCGDMRDMNSKQLQLRGYAWYELSTAYSCGRMRDTNSAQFAKHICPFQAWPSCNKCIKTESWPHRKHPVCIKNTELHGNYRCLCWWWVQFTLVLGKMSKVHVVQLLILQLTQKSSNRRKSKLCADVFFGLLVLRLLSLTD